PPDLRDVELAPEQMDDDVERAEARPQVAGAGALDGRQSVGPAHVGEERQVVAGALELGTWNQLQRYGHGCSARTSSFTSAPHPGADAIASVPSRIFGTALVTSSRHATSSTSTSRMRTFGIAAHHCAEMNVARWL